eukprot:12063536-Alexandrium_andersonii.AAC.1
MPRPTVGPSRPRRRRHRAAERTGGAAGPSPVESPARRLWTAASGPRGNPAEEPRWRSKSTFTPHFP